MLLLSIYCEFGIIKLQIIKKIPQISQICEVYRTDLVAKEMRLVRIATQKEYQLYQSLKLWQSIGHKNDSKIICASNRNKKGCLLKSREPFFVIAQQGFNIHQ